MGFRPEEKGIKTEPLRPIQCGKAAGWDSDLKKKGLRPISGRNDRDTLGGWDSDLKKKGLRQ